MKKVFIFLALAATLQLANAQSAFDKASQAKLAALEKAQATSQNPKQATKLATWTKLATAYVDVYSASMGSGLIGTSQQNTHLLAGKPQSSEQVTVNGQAFIKDIYPAYNYYYNANGALAVIEITKPLVEDALGKALEAYQKAAELDTKGSKAEDIAAGIGDIVAKYQEEAFYAYTLGNFEVSSNLFESATNASIVEPFNQLDTISLYNAGFVAHEAGLNERAKEVFERCLNEFNYEGEGGEIYAKLGDIYIKLGEGDKGSDLLETGFSKYPESQAILIGLINYYMENNQDTGRLFELINVAKANEPNNASLYYVEGNIYKELKQIENAVAAYMKCSEINPEYEYGYIGAGVLYYENAVELSEKASNEFDDAKYNALVEQFEASLLNALEPFEKAFEITKDETLKVSIAEYLKNIYYRFISKGEQYQAGYDKYDAIAARK